MSIPEEAQDIPRMRRLGRRILQEVSPLKDVLPVLNLITLFTTMCCVAKESYVNTGMPLSFIDPERRSNRNT